MKYAVIALCSFFLSTTDVVAAPNFAIGETTEFKGETLFMVQQAVEFPYFSNGSEIYEFRQTFLLNEKTLVDLRDFSSEFKRSLFSLTADSGVDIEVYSEDETSCYTESSAFSFTYDSSLSCFSYLMLTPLTSTPVRIDLDVKVTD